MKDLTECSQCTQHKCQSINPGEEAHFVKEFSWIVLQPGPGHLEINMLSLCGKSFGKTLWNSSISGVKNAKKSARKVNDHHKGMTLARIAHESLGKELVLPYVRERLEYQEDMSVAGFMKFVMTRVRNPCYALMVDSILELLHPLFMFRDGV